jgi:hypothetical protein
MHTRREHFTAWLLCSSAAWLSGLSCALVRSPADGASIAGIAGVVSMSVIVTAALYYGSRRKPEDIFALALVSACFHALFFIGMIVFLGIFVHKLSRYPPAENPILYDGAIFLWRMYWPWFILATLVTISLIGYWGCGRALRLK